MKKSKKPSSAIITKPTKPQTMPEVISTTGFVDAFKRIHEIMPNRQFAFILGAGASKSSGIRLASEMVADWTSILYRQSTCYPHVPESTWATAENLKVDGFDPKDPAASYPAFYKRMFANDPDLGYAYLEDQMAEADPSYGYSVLGRIMANERHKVVVTVNFDNLVADSLSIFSTNYPLVCGHEALAQFARVDLRRPLVLKVHRDLLLNPMSHPGELSKPEPNFAAAIEKLLHRYTPIVIGYGGNDDSLMHCLETIPANTIPGGVYWCYRQSGEVPPQRILDFVAKQSGKLVPILGFDELMVLLGGALNICNPKEDVLQRAAERVERLANQLKKFEINIEQAASKPTTLPDAAQSEASNEESVLSNTLPMDLGERTQNAASARTSELDKVAKELEKLSGQTATGKRWWEWQREALSEPDLDKRDAIYRAARTALPDSHELMGSYAAFLHDSRRDDNEAESLYKGSIAAEPKNAVMLGNYGLFLERVREDNKSADVMYKRAIDADPKHAALLSNYAFFLHNFGDAENADSMYKRAVEANPKNANCLSNYAVFLQFIRKDATSLNAAEEMYKQAIAADGKHAHALAGYALFLDNVRNAKNSAEVMYKRAIEADPTNADYSGNYCRLLLSDGRVEDGLARLDNAIVNLNLKTPKNTNLECWMYAYCCRPESAKAEALGKIKYLIIENKLKTGEWDFSGVIAQAIKMNHSEFDWLPKLAEVVAGRADQSTLAEWERWREVPDSSASNELIARTKTEME